MAKVHASNATSTMAHLVDASAVLVLDCSRKPHVCFATMHVRRTDGTKGRLQYLLWNKHVWKQLFHVPLEGFALVVTSKLQSLGDVTVCNSFSCRAVSKRRAR